MSLSKRKVTTFDGVRRKLDRYCQLADKMREYRLTQDELTLMCRERTSYCSLGQVFRQRLLVLLQMEREEADAWRRTIASQFPEWFDLPGKQEDQFFMKDWEILRELGENAIFPDTQLAQLKLIENLVKSLIDEKLKREKETPGRRSYVDAAVQTNNGPWDGPARSTPFIAQPPVHMASKTAPRPFQSYTKIPREIQVPVTQSPRSVEKPSPSKVAPLFTQTSTFSPVPAAQQYPAAPMAQTEGVTIKRPPKRQRQSYSHSSSSSSAYEPDSASFALASSLSSLADDALSFLEEVSVIATESDIDQQQDHQESEDEEGE
ncbi:hypothetical protein B0T21DRAFT_405943 [Apiosordaria backusii]|uniref:Uncharacterized protein n=1 Tax=Apiosordaria backusii TaxID=314023 RepID=A0AA40EXD8_9PEZI|nr:hypothetical protein B0T21DRAFT_405943 [Apiosordaria backusii]